MPYFWFGNDGGSMPHRSEMVKLKKPEPVVDPKKVAKSKATLCTISKAPLERPIVMCKLGRLYNKVEVMEKLIAKSMPEEFKYIRGLKDIKTVKLNDNKDKTSKFPFSCPVTQVPYNGLKPFMALWSCGCVFSK